MSTNENRKGRSEQLIEIIDCRGKEILLDSKAFAEALREKQLSGVEQMQLLLLTKVSGFEEFMLGSDHILQNDLERFVSNAQQESGLSKWVILGLTADLAAALGYDAAVDDAAFYAAQDYGMAYVIPRSIYEKEQASIQASVEKNTSWADLSDDDQDRLEMLAAAGSPWAKFNLAWYMKQTDEEKAAGLLKSAADDGYSKAQSALGDYYYKLGGGSNWTKAYECYTGYGSLALNAARKKNLVNIINNKKYNQKVLLFGLVFWAAMFAMSFVHPAASLYGRDTAVRTIALLCNAGLLGAAVYRYREHPYDFMNWLLPSMFGVWWIYLCIWLLT